MLVPRERPRSHRNTGKVLRGMGSALSRMFEVGQRVQRDLEQAQELGRTRGWGRDR
jgi:hypothetical protein